MYSDLDIIKALKQARERVGLTQKDVEAELSLRPLLIRDYEIGRLKLPLQVALQLADLYRVSLDQLVGLSSASHPHEVRQTLANFSAIFSGISYQVMFLDPILRAYFEDNREQFFDQSLFDVLTIDLTNQEKKKFIIEIGKLLFSLAGCDGKISDSEMKTIRHILALFELLKNYREISTYGTELIEYKQIPPFFKGIEIRHFIIWVLFLFSKADGKISTEEFRFIEGRAEELKINRSNFISIRKHFVREEF